ncbi:uncharacterized protein LOC127120086 [Lathyrus oleraceus]|uniref:uncharacterized protein LOC127120086 n=1 Tax=Pisum sativum TaxID=3888 RepID=UPI001FC6455B|nr:uncharacterized protein LOC127120086 [Pisum sativum]
MASSFWMFCLWLVGVLAVVARVHAVAAVVVHPAVYTACVILKCARNATCISDAVVYRFRVGFLQLVVPVFALARNFVMACAFLEAAHFGGSAFSSCCLGFG